jgi:ribose transport system permease protein
VILLAVLVAAALFMRSGTGRTLVAVGDNENAVRLAGGRVDRLKVLAFALSGLLAALAAILLGGFAGVSAQVGEGLEFRAITAVVLGGVLLGGGRGSVVAAAAGALTLEALFSLLNLLGVAGALESAVQGVIIIAAVAYAALGVTPRLRFRRRAGTPEPARR